MRLHAVMDRLRRLAPESLAESWDQVGLHVGDPQQQIRRGLLCIDLTEAVLEEAIAAKANLVVAYHPPIFKPLTRLTAEDTRQRIILHAANRRIAVYSPHTALDAAAGGVNDFLAAACGEGKVTPIVPTPAPTEYKLVVFVPHEYADKLRAALSDSGAGVIGDYTQCSFGTPGEGTFRGGDSTNPAIGERGAFERVEELRMEMVCPAPKFAEVMATLREVHPYEEPAFDLFRMHNPAPPAGTGQGRIVELDKPVALRTLASRLKKALGIQRLEVNATTGGAAGSERVQRIGVCAGAGGSLLESAGDIDAFFTGEMRHHDILAALAEGVSVMLAGHTETERPYLMTYCERIQREIGKGVTWSVSRRDMSPGWLM